MPNPDRPPLTRAVVLRSIGFAAAVALGAVAVWLTVTSDSQKSLRIGILVGLWGLLLGAYSMFGARRGMGVEAIDDPSREIALRENRTIERSDDADARRDWESRLERLIAREISTAVGRETAALRNEIAHLRQELLEKVGGQLRLERIETTRVIGSDLEALQDEVRQLKDASGSHSVRELLIGTSDPRVAVRPIVEPARVRPVSRPTAEVEADVRPAVRPDTPAAAAVTQRPEQHVTEQPHRPAENARPVEPVASAEPAQPAERAQPAEPAQPARSAQPAPAAATHRDGAGARAPVSHAAQSRTAGAAASQLWGGQRRSEAPPLRPTTAATADGPVEAAARVHRAPTAAGQPPRAAASQPPQRATQHGPTQGPTQLPRQDEPQPAPTSPPDVSRQAPPDPTAAKQPSAPPPQQSAPPEPDPADPFAALPRLSRFTDFELDPVDSRTAGGNGNGNGNTHSSGDGDGNDRPVDNGNGNGSDDAREPIYSGRRRRSADEAAEPADSRTNNGATPAPQSTGGRRRREVDADDGSELLARLLARETSER